MEIWLPVRPDQSEVRRPDVGGAETSAVEPLVKRESVEVNCEYAGAGAGSRRGLQARAVGSSRRRILSRRWMPEPMQAGDFTGSLMHHVVAREIRG